MWHGESDRLGDGRMLAKDFVQFFGRYLLATSRNNLLEAPG